MEPLSVAAATVISLILGAVAILTDPVTIQVPLGDAAPVFDEKIASP